MDPRLSNTATHADHWLPTYPGSEVDVLLTIANVLIREKLYDREFVRRWVNWEEFLRATLPNEPPTFDRFERELERLYADYTPERTERETGVPAKTIVDVAHAIGKAGSAFSAHNWRAAAAGNLGGWMTARCLFFLNVLTGSVGTEGGVVPNSWTKFVPAPHARPPHPTTWNELTWPKEYPLAFFEMSFLLPHFLKEGRGSLDVYFTRVYNPVWTNPDGFSWIEVLRDESMIGRHAALTPVWSETAWFADYVLPVGLGSERHDLASFETHAGSWVGFRQPVQARDRGAARPRRDRHARREPGRGVGGERVLDRAVVAHRPRRRDGNPQALRVAVSPRRKAAHRRVLPLDLRELGAGAARGGGARRTLAARVHAQVRVVRDSRRRVRPARVGALAGGEGRVVGRRRDDSACSRHARPRRRRTSCRCQRPRVTRKAGAPPAS